MEFPEVVSFDASDDEDAAAAALADRVADLGVAEPFVVSSRYGEILAGKLRGRHPDGSFPRVLDQGWADELGSQAHGAGADAVVAIGGGRILDIGKLAAARAGVALIAVPTQLSHDGICSPVAVVPGEEGRSESLGAIAPRLVFLSMPTLVRAPMTSANAGIGDLIANMFALRDWALAAEHGLDEIDQRAWDLSAQSFSEIESYLNDPPERPDVELAARLGGALVTSGTAMIVSGTSRPASGAEHEISHAIDHELGGRALHGAQVAFGCLFSAVLYEEDTAALARSLQRLGLPTAAEDLGLSDEEMVDLLLAAPATRPGRFTILEDADLDRASATELVRRVRAVAGR
ncbi:MAG: iron-containing alcohol dehydrogenase [Actinomycetota bacterium]|nr:iron-containing alcohol dehydrogenase [Actinomycetota bacterium]